MLIRLVLALLNLNALKTPAANSSGTTRVMILRYMLFLKVHNQLVQLIFQAV